MMVSSFGRPRRTWRTRICLLGSDGSLQSAHLSLGISLLRTKRKRHRMPPNFCQNEVNGLMMCFSTGGVVTTGCTGAQKLGGSGATAWGGWARLETHDQ